MNRKSSTDTQGSTLNRDTQLCQLSQRDIVSRRNVVRIEFGTSSEPASPTTPYSLGVDRHDLEVRNGTVTVRRTKLQPSS